MANIYIEKWEVWSTTNCKLLKYDTDNLRKSFREMADWDDEKIKQYLEDNDGNIEFNDADDKSGEWWDVSEDAYLQICEDRSKDYDEIMNHFLTTMKTYEFEEWVDEDEEE
jgi:hypothetical protein